MITPEEVERLRKTAEECNSWCSSQDDITIRHISILFNLAKAVPYLCDEVERLRPAKECSPEEDDSYG